MGFQDWAGHSTISGVEYHTSHCPPDRLHNSSPPDCSPALVAVGVELRGFLMHHSLLGVYHRSLLEGQSS